MVKKNRPNKGLDTQILERTLGNTMKASHRHPPWALIAAAFIVMSVGLAHARIDKPSNNEADLEAPPPVTDTNTLGPPVISDLDHPVVVSPTSFNPLASQTEPRAIIGSDSAIASRADVKVPDRPFGPRERASPSQQAVVLSPQTEEHWAGFVPLE